MQTNDLAVRSGIRHEQDQSVEAAVSKLQSQPSTERLKVVQAGLGFDRDPQGRRLPGRIPRTKVARVWEWHFGTPADRRMRHRPQAIDERRLRGIPDRVAHWIRANGQLETQQGEEACCHLEVKR
jgi:hypothetical protein